MHLTTLLTSGLVLAGSALVQATYHADEGSSKSSGESGYGYGDSSYATSGEEGASSGEGSDGYGDGSSWSSSQGGEGYDATMTWTSAGTAAAVEQSTSTATTWDSSAMYSSAMATTTAWDSSATETLAIATATAPDPSASATSGTSTAAAGAAASSGAAGVKVHVVKVGDESGTSLTFSPADIKAAVGDMVQFHFYPKNHSVVQSTFDQPCEPISNHQPNVQGIFSGFMPVSANSTEMPSFTIPVTDTKPIWFYCSQGKHCQSGMVGVINAPAANTSRTLESYKELAAKASQNLSPTQINGGSSSSGTATTLATATSTSQPSGVAGGTGSVPSSTDGGLPQATGGVGSLRLGGNRELVGTAAAVGFVACVMGFFM